MAKQGTEAAAKVSPLVRMRSFYDDVLAEMKKVTWPSMDELKTSTSVVLFLLAAIALIIFAYDRVFQLFVLGLFNLV